jgi:hypothetical protein
MAYFSLSSKLDVESSFNVENVSGNLNVPHISKSQFKWQDGDQKALISLTKKYFPWGADKIGKGWCNVTTEFNEYIAKQGRTESLKEQSIKLKVNSLLEKYMLYKTKNQRASGVVLNDSFLQKDLQDLQNRIETKPKKNGSRKSFSFIGDDPPSAAFFSKDSIIS